MKNALALSYGNIQKLVPFWPDPGPQQDLKNSQISCKPDLDIRYITELIVQCFTSLPTQYRLYGRRFSQVKRPNQQYQEVLNEKAVKENNPKTERKHKLHICIHTQNSIQIQHTSLKWLHKMLSKNIPTIILNYLSLWCMHSVEQNISLQNILKTYFKCRWPMNEVHIDIV